jgi:ubiquinone/menaquinone biosynthesis C-methylase UbiE
MSENHGATIYTERMIPVDAHARVFWEHIARYRFAKEFVRGKRVLDLACGEGYGAAALKKAGAVSVTGIDNSKEICEHARRKYGLDARLGDAHTIPLEDRSMDVVVSFETIEHVTDPETFLKECARVLALPGMAIISTPNRPVYSSNGRQNPFHCREFNETEFADLLLTRFRSVKLYTQFPKFASWWSIRSLAAERSPWLRIKGFWRLASWFCPAIRTDLDPVIRASTDDVILARDIFPASLFNPYLVRSRSQVSHELPYILIALAEGVKTT